MIRSVTLQSGIKMKTSQKRTFNTKILVLFFLFLLFLILRLPSLIEPYWYGDEGIYQVIGQALFKGETLYTDIYDNKPPLLYVLYGLVNGDQLLIRTLSLFAGLLSLVGIFTLSIKLFNKVTPAIITSSIFTILFATPFIEGNIANAENFMLVLLLTAGYLIYIQHKNSNKKYIFTAGVLLGLAFLFKIVAVFDFIAFFIFLLSCLMTGKHTRINKRTMHIILLYITGFLAPFIITCCYFLLQGNFIEFFQASFFGNVQYVGWGNDFLNIPQGLLIIKVLLVIIFTSVIYFHKDKLSKSELFIYLWLCFSVFSAFFSGRPYTHYVLVLLPAYCLSIGLIFIQQTKTAKIRTTSLLICATMMITLFFPFYSVTKTLHYYQNTIQYVTGKISPVIYRDFFDPKVNRDYALAEFIRSHTIPSDSLFIWGNNAQIYALSDKTPITKYTVAYHVNDETAFSLTQKAIDSERPKYIIVLKESSPLPFRVPLYIMRFSLEGAYIYERSI